MSDSWVIEYLLFAAWNANRSSTHSNNGITPYVRHLTATIYIIQYMTTRDLHFRIACHSSCRVEPFALRIRIISGTTGEHIAIERMSIGSLTVTTFRRHVIGIVTVFICILVVRSAIVHIRPVVRWLQRCWRFRSPIVL